MRQMKDSGVEYIGDIPKDWIVTRIKRECTIFTGNSIKNELKDEYLDEKDAVPYISTKDINVDNGCVDYQNGMYVKNDDINFRIAPKNSTLLCIEGGSAGKKVAFTNQDVAFVNKLCCIYPNRSLSKFINYYVQSPAFFNEFTSNLSGLIGGVSVGILSNQRLSLPNIEKQISIVDYLDQKISLIDDIIEKTKQSIEEYKKLKQSIITEAVTKGLNSDVKMKYSGIEWIGMIPEHYTIVRPHHICKVVRGNSSFQKDDLKDSGDYVALQYGKTYKVDEVDDNFQFYVNDTFYKESQIVNYGDIVLISTSETIEDLGHSCYYNRNKIGLLGGEQMCLKPNSDIIESKFLYYASRYFKYEINQFASGLKVYRYNTDDLKKISVIVPPIKEQKKTVNFLDNRIPLMNNMILSKEIFIGELETYKKSLIYEVVTGKKEIA